MIKRDTGLSELQESLLIMNAIAKVVRIALQNYARLSILSPHWRKVSLNGRLRFLQIRNRLY